MTDKKQEMRAEAEKTLLEGAKIWSNGRYELMTMRPQVHVRDLITGKLVAWSNVNADFEAAVKEFCYDYAGETK